MDSTPVQTEALAPPAPDEKGQSAFRILHSAFKSLRLFRPLNLAIVALAQWLVAAAAIWPAFRATGVWWAVGVSFLIKIMAATILVAASGYVINDIFDEKTDRVNRPVKQVVGQFLSKKGAARIYSLLVLGVLAMTWLVARDSLPEARRLNWWLFPGVAAALFVYSWLLKGTPFLGNLLIAAFCAAVPLVVYFQEKRPLEVLAMHSPERAQLVDWLVLGYAFFAGATTLLREMIKDLEDRPGDLAAGLRTAPVVFGEKAVRWTAFLVAAALVFFLGKGLVVLRPFFEKGWMFWSAAGLLGVPALFVAAKLPSAAAPGDHRRLSIFVKVLMVAGLLLLALLGPVLLK